MWDLFREDLKRWVMPSQYADDAALTPRTILRLLWQHLPLRATLLFRIGHRLWELGVPGLPGWLQRVIYRRHGLEIPIAAEIGPGLYIAHPNGTVLAAASIGRNVSVIADVVLGMRNQWAFPTIGDEVFLGAGAKVLGDITVGDRAQIGANAVVIHDVPAGSTVVGIPGRVIKIDGERVS